MNILKGILFFLALFITLMLISYKISAIMRLAKFEQEETKQEAYGAVITMLIISVLWSVLYIIN